MPPHLLVALSAHGYGHASQTVAVLNALRARLPDLRLTLATALPHEFLAARLDGSFTSVRREVDVGMRMDSALDVRRDDSHAAYARFHANWETRVQAEARWLEELALDLVCANVPYLVLAGAARAGIPAVAMCSLNWADIYQHYFGRDRRYEEMLAAYRSAHTFLCLTPGMPMNDLPNRQVIGPVARIGRARRAELRRRLGIDDATRVVLIAPGGIAWRLPIESWPPAPQVRWLVPASWQVRMSGAIAFEDLDWPFVDVLASCDAVIGKPGYGTFTEAACNAVPMLFVRRADDWPEEPYLIEWFERHARAREVARGVLERGEFFDDLNRLWMQPSPGAPSPEGVAQAVACLARHFSNHQQTIK
jgi:hypothetical protein